MRINDLFEHKIDGFVEYKNGEPELKFDLAEDLTYFMNNDDESYRRHLYPVIALCLKKSKNNDSFSPAIFKKATMECYKNYLKQFPIRELPEELDDKLTKAVCERLHEEFQSHLRDDKYN
mgnify:CR=1 FL=1